jgi:TldD protein
MRELAERGLDTAVAGGASYADCRVVSRSVQVVVVKNGAVARIALSEDEGIGVRVIVDGAWGFAGGDRLDGPGIDATVARALRTARASARLRGRPVVLAPVQPVVGEYRTPVQQDPFQVSLESKVDLLLRADAAMSRVPQITVREGSVEVSRERRYFASSEGARLDQTFVGGGGPPGPPPPRARRAAARKGASQAAAQQRRDPGDTHPRR